MLIQKKPEQLTDSTRLAGRVLFDFLKVRSDQKVKASPRQIERIENRPIVAFAKTETIHHPDAVIVGTIRTLR